MNPQLATLLVPALNHLLAQEPWAMQQLQVHAGKIACIDLSMLTLRVQITGQGLLDACGSDVTANVTIRINPADLGLIMQDKQRAISYVKLEGDADLAQTLSDLGKNLRWDAQHQLSALFGDLAARRIATTGKAMLDQVQHMGVTLQENLAEYFLEENPMLIRPIWVAEFSEQTSRIRDDVERLMKRIEKLEQSSK